MKDNNLKDKVVVITGASAGVGRATAVAFAKRGARIALIARGLDRLADAKKEIEALGGIAEYYPLDVSEAEKFDEVVEQIEKDLGLIDIWINNAMASVFSPFIDIDPKDFARVAEVTYLGQVYGTMAALKKMQPRNKGTIVLIGSALAYRGIPLQSAYCSAKHGVEGLFESIRCELFHQKSNIHLTIVHLPAVNTPQFDWVKCNIDHKPKPMGTVYQPEVPADAIVFAATHKRREVYVGLSTHLAILGNKVAGWFLDRYLGRVGYKGQKLSEKVSPDRQNNLWQPVKGLYGAHGDFDSIAHNFSICLIVTKYRKTVAIILLIIIALIIYGILR